MCYKIDSDLILPNIFSQQRTEIKIKDLVALKNRIESQVALTFVDMSHYSLCSTLEYYPNMYEWNGEKIKQKSGSDEYFQPEVLKNRFNINLPSQIRRQVVKIIHESV